MACSQASRPTYSNEQIDAYLEYIPFPEDHRISKEDAHSEKGLSFLQQLLKHQLISIPFENLDLHYSTHHSISLDTENLFQKVVGRKNGRGGYCMENNTLFGTILRSIGFDVTPVGARVSTACNLTSGEGLDQAQYQGFSHTVNIVTIAGKKYFCDVGFGARGPTTAIPLIDGVSGRSVGGKDGGTLFRLTHDNIADSAQHNPEQKLWVYSSRFDENMPWLPNYCFTEVEFLPVDFVNMSFYTSKSPTSFFTYRVVCQKFIIDEENGDIVGDITLYEKAMKERRNGKSRTLCEINSEADRVGALKKYFGISFTKPEVHSIRGLASEIH